MPFATTKRRNREMRIVERPSRKAVEADDHDVVASGAGRSRLFGAFGRAVEGDEQQKHEDPNRTAMHRTLLPEPRTVTSWNVMRHQPTLTAE
jgi:hypothetical protein